MTEEMRFFIYLLEHYAADKGIPADAVLREWDDLQISDRIFDMYEIYHIESLDNAYADIDRMMDAKRSNTV